MARFMDVSPLAVSPPAWTIRPMHVDVSPPELSVFAVSPSRCGRFDVKPLALASEVKSLALASGVKSLALASVVKSLASEAKVKNT